MKALSKLRQHFDWPLFLAICVLCAVGVVNLYSATSSTQLTLVRQQLTWIGVALGVFTVTTLFDYRLLTGLAYPLYGIGVLLLLLVLVVGKSVNESQRWIFIGGLGLQPSEIMKPIMIVVLAKYLADDPVTEGGWVKHVAIPILLVGAPMVLVLKQPDLGTAMIIFLIFLSVLTLIKLKLRAILLLMAVALVSAPLAWHYLLKGYQKQRIYTFLNPELDPVGAGWQSRQSVFAVGSGGFVGKGYMQGTQNQFHFLPERWTDFPFAVWAEEWGFLGSVLLLGIYVFLVLWAVKIATQARDRFGAVLCVGVAALYFWHVVISVGMVIGIVPVVGVTLPFVSYGGSSLVTMFCATGLLMNVAVRKSSF
ncbi:MAG: rod shape-determining protein RodA [Deltaproteobacteria bacterium]|nr:rod shape-determining protein RodA [Deltaproteobacteria bacterium]